MSLAETCWELAHGDGWNALGLALLAVGHGATSDFTICPCCGNGFEGPFYNSRFCTEQCRKNWHGRTTGRGSSLRPRA